MITWQGFAFGFVSGALAAALIFPLFLVVLYRSLKRQLAPLHMVASAAARQRPSGAGS